MHVLCHVNVCYIKTTKQFFTSGSFWWWISNAIANVGAFEIAQETWIYSYWTSSRRWVLTSAGARKYKKYAILRLFVISQLKLIIITLNFIHKSKQSVHIIQMLNEWKGVNRFLGFGKSMHPMSSLVIILPEWSRQRKVYIELLAFDVIVNELINARPFFIGLVWFGTVLNNIWGNKWLFGYKYHNKQTSDAFVVLCLVGRVATWCSCFCLMRSFEILMRTSRFSFIRKIVSIFYYRLGSWLLLAHSSTCDAQHRWTSLNFVRGLMRWADLVLINLWKMQNDWTFQRFSYPS